ncbi:MAG: methyltransferase family protein [Acidimicrobiales bacterium]
MRRTMAKAGSAVWFVVAPGGVAGAIPWWLTGWRAGQPVPPLWLRTVGAALAGVGAAVLVHAFARFVVEGFGTPAPVAPPERLVVGGLYRHVRNPMYVAVVAIIVGQALVLGRPVLLLYAVAAALTMALFTHAFEEPELRHRFGADYDAYRSAVPAWWPRLRP